MRWQSREQSDNVEDRRQMGGRTMLAGGGIGTLVIILIVSAVFGVNPLQLLQQMPQGQQGGGGGQQAPFNPREEQEREFVGVVLKDTENVWVEQFELMGMTYRKPKLVPFSGTIQSGCGFASSQTGPFYCPSDEKVYIDLSFFDEMQTRLGAKGDFARAYVIAHEIGHHVQNLLGTTDRVHSQRRRLSDEQYNQLSVRLELQADYLAGVFAHHLSKKKDIVEPGDIEEAMNAANAIGDDRLQKESQGYVVPDSFTHGTSAQRVRWFKKGFLSGDPRGGDTFATDDL